MIIQNATISNMTVVDQLQSLYYFSTFTFTNGNIQAPTSGNTAQFLSTYATNVYTWLNSNVFYTVTTPGYQKWTVPQDGLYEIEVAGSRSSMNPYAGNSYGSGSIVRARFPLTKNSNLTIAVGSYTPPPTVSAPSYTGVGGGGGSFVVLANNAPLIIAGGGGGAGRYSGSTDGNANSKFGVNGSTNTYGTSSRQSPFGNAAPGGTLGQGGNSHVAANGSVSTNSYDAGGGGGFYSNGVNGTGGNVRTNATSGSTGGGGQGWFANLIGGVYSTTYATQSTPGGFGGGGGAGPITGGGGGGYSGGGGSYTTSATSSDGGGGGGSYIDVSGVLAATSDGFYNGSAMFGLDPITNLNNYNQNAGYVKVTFIG